MTALLILSYNNSEATINCIESILRYNTAPVKFFVVDNCSTKPGSVEKLDEYLSEKFAGSYLKISDGDAPCGALPAATFMASGSNDGYAGGNNKGLRHILADGETDSVAVMNNDILFVEDILPGIRSFRDERGDCGVISPLLLKRSGVEPDPTTARTHMSDRQILMRFFRYPLFRSRTLRDVASCNMIQTDPRLLEKGYFEMDMPNGSFLFFPLGVMRELGGFDPGTFLYYEENILARRIARLGLKCYCIPSLKIIHLGSDTINSVNSEFLMRCSFESAMYYLREYGSMSGREYRLWKRVRAAFPCKLKTLFFIKGLFGGKWGKGGKKQNRR